jgi:hypothetical protein
MNTKGQSLIELVMILPIAVAFWAALVCFAQVVIISIELMHTARHGAFWLAYHHAPEEPAAEARRVAQECRAFLKAQAPLLDPDRIRLTIETGDRWQAVGPKTLLDIPQLVKLAVRLERTLKEAAGLVRFKPAEVTVEYKLAAPRFLRLIPGFPAVLPLRGHCAVYR